MCGWPTSEHRHNHAGLYCYPGPRHRVLALMEYAVWSLTILLLLTGLVGSVLPLLPGTTLIFFGVLLQKWLLHLA